MSRVSEWCENPEMRLVRREGGGWLAASVLGAPLSIAVVGASSDQARARFAGLVAAWRELLDDTSNMLMVKCWLDT
jgi:hypothetical protein